MPGMAMFRDWLTSPARTRTDRRLRNRILVVFLLFTAVVYGGLYLSGFLPPTLQYAIVGPALLVVFLVGNGLMLWRRADWQNRATTSRDEAHSREERARILGGE